MLWIPPWKQFVVPGRFTLQVDALYYLKKGLKEVGGFDELWRRYPLAVVNSTDTNCSGEVHPHWDQMLRGLSDPDFPWLGFILGGIPTAIWYVCVDQVRKIVFLVAGLRLAMAWVPKNLRIMPKMCSLPLASDTPRSSLCLKFTWLPTYIFILQLGHGTTRFIS